MNSTFKSILKWKSRPYNWFAVLFAALLSAAFYPHWISCVLAACCGWHLCMLATSWAANESEAERIRNE